MFLQFCFVGLIFRISRVASGGPFFYALPEKKGGEKRGGWVTLTAQTPVASARAEMSFSVSASEKQ